MTFGAVGSSYTATAPFTITPSSTNDFILMTIVSANVGPVPTGASSSNISWAIVAGPTQGGHDNFYSTTLLGTVLSTSGATCTPVFSGPTPSYFIHAHEYSTTAGVRFVNVDVSAIMSAGTTNNFPTLTPSHGSGELYYSFAYNDGAAVAGSTSGFTYYVDAHFNGACWDASCANAATTPVWGDLGPRDGIAVMLYEAGTAWPNVYTYNFCSNPSFELDLTGVQAINGGVPVLDTGTGLYGAQSLQVSTPGLNPNEGVILPPGTVLGSAAGCASFYLVGSTPTSSGTLTAYAIDTTTSTVLGSVPVEFDPTQSWQRVVINGLPLTIGDSIAVYIETVGTQQVEFNVDAVQYEPALVLNAGVLPTPYMDGDQLYGDWVGSPAESASYTPYQFMVSGTGGIRLGGYGSLLQIGEIFPLVNTDPASGPSAIQGYIDLSGKTFQGIDGPIIGAGGTVVASGITVVLMKAGLDDFAIFQQSTDVDPAMSLVGYNNAGQSTGTNTSGDAGYTRLYSTFSAPTAFQGSTGKNIWNTAAYFAVGYEFGSIAAGGSQNITHVQAETVPGNGLPTVPSSYIRPRALTAILAPTRLNYVPNPSFEVSTAGWNADSFNTTTTTRVAGGAVTGSSWSGQVVTTGANNGVYVAVPDLIVGEQYTVSAYMQNTTNATANTGRLAVGTAFNTVSLPQNTWERISLTFTAVTSNVLVDFQIASTGTMLIDAVMLEVGGALNAYADGSFSGWNWETPASAGLTRSYYYERGNIAYAAVQSVLSDHLPLGLTAYSPVYNTPVTQYSA